MDEYIGQQHAPLRSNLAPKGTNDELVEDFFNRLRTLLTHSSGLICYFLSSFALLFCSTQAQGADF